LGKVKGFTGAPRGSIGVHPIGRKGTMGKPHNGGNGKEKFGGSARKWGRCKRAQVT